MTNHMDTFRLRVKRARQNVSSFDRISRNFFKPPPYEMITEREPRIENDFFTINIQPTKFTPRSLGFIFAECIHNLRSVVDNVIWQLGQNHGTPEGISFPVTFHPNVFSARLNDGVNNLSLLPHDALTLIEQLQPYHLDNPHDHPLWILSRLWNNDKHRTAVMVAAISNETLINIDPVATITISGPQPLDRDFQLTGIAVLQNIEIDVQVQFAHEIILEIDGPVAGGANARALLLELHNFVRDEVVNKFEPFF